MAMSGEQPNEEKYSIASEALPKYKELPLLKRISLSNLLNSLLDGWCIVVTIVLPDYKAQVNKHLITTFTNLDIKKTKFVKYLCNVM